MNRVLVGCILVAVAVSLWPAQTFAQSPTPSSGCEQLAELTVAIHDLVSELRDANTRESHHRNLLIAIQYLQFRSRSIESLEEEVRRTQDRKDSTADIIERSADELDAMREKLAELTGEEANEMRSAIERFERRSESFEAAIDRYERKIVDLENQILESRRQLLALEDYVIENLNLEP